MNIEDIDLSNATLTPGAGGQIQFGGGYAIQAAGDRWVIAYVPGGAPLMDRGRPALFESATEAIRALQTYAREVRQKGGDSPCQ